MQREDLKDWTWDRLKEEIVKLHNKLDLFGIKFEENPNDFSFSYHGTRYWAGTLANDIIALKEKKKKLMTENKVLRQKIQDIEDTFASGVSKIDESVLNLQDQHQQDCIKINQLHVTIDTLVDKYSRLRKTVGID